MTKAKIMHLIGSLDVGGTEKMLLSLAENSDKRKYDVSVSCLIREGSLAEEFRRKNIRLHVVGMKNRFDFTVILRLIKLIKREKVDILHTYLFYSNIAGRIAGTIAGVPVIISSERSTSEWKNIIHKTIELLTDFMVDKTIANSQAVKKSLINDVGLSGKKIDVIPNGINLENYDKKIDTGKKKKQLGLTPSKKIVGTVTRLHPEKAPQDFVRAAATLKKKFPDVQFIMVGDGRMRTKLESMVSELGLKEDFVFTGVRDDVSEIIQVMDVFALTSLWEGMPGVVLEAMAWSKPVVATNVGGTPEVVDDGATGFLVPAGDADAAAQATLFLLQNSEKAREMGGEGRRKVESNFALNDMVKQTESLYDKLSHKNNEK